MVSVPASTLANVVAGGVPVSTTERATVALLLCQAYGASSVVTGAMLSTYTAAEEIIDGTASPLTSLVAPTVAVLTSAPFAPGAAKKSTVMVVC